MPELRSDIRIPISLLILVSEDLNSTQSFEGRTLNVSSHGMQVQIDGMNEESYGNISSKVGLIRLSFKNTYTGRPIQLSGCIAWHVYHEAEDSWDPCHCNMGVLFGEKDNLVGLAAYSNFVNRLTRA